MTQGSASPKSSRRGILPCLLIVFAGLIGLIIIGGVGVFLLSRSIKSGDQSFLTVISSPTTGLTALSGQPIDIRASSEFSRGVTRLDVFADGGLISSQTSSLTGGSNPLVLLDSWVPKSPGRHVLMARARSKDGRTSDSAVVFIDVGQEVYRTAIEVSDLRTESGNPPTLNEIAASTGISVGELLEANPDLEGTDPDDPLDPDTELFLPPSGSEGGAEEPLPGYAPAPPEDLAVTMTCTEATLTWHDVSTDEEHYVIYRIAPGSSNMNQIGAPLPHNTEDFVDTLAGPGTYYYQVGARGGGEESFSMVVAATTPGGCGAPPPGALDLVLTMAVVETDNVFSGLHCFANIQSAGDLWDRFPAGDFTGLPAAAPRIFHLYSLPSNGRYNLSFHNPTANFELRMVCYGRNPPIADHIGEAFVSHPPVEWDGTVRTAHSVTGTNGNFTLYYCLGPAATPCAIPGVPPIADTPWMTDPFLPPPTNLRMENSTETCLDLPPGIGRMMCELMGAILGGYPTLLWDWNGAPYYTEDDLTGYHVVLRRTHRATGTTAVSDELNVLRRPDGTLGRAVEDHVNHGMCGFTYRYYVSAVAGDRRSSESIPVVIENPDCFEPVDVTVDFQNIHISDPVDDCGDFLGPDTIIDAMGHYEIYFPGTYWPRFLNPAVGIPAGTDTTINALWGYSNTRTIQTNSDVGTLTIDFTLRDEDNIIPCNNEPNFCDVRVEMPARSRAEWLVTDETFVESSSANPEGGCTVTISVKGSDAP